MPHKWTIRALAGEGQAFIELSGLDPASLDDPAVRDELLALWLTHGVVVFRDVAGPEAHIKLSKCFGPFQVHPIKQSDSDPNHRELINVQYSPSRGDNTIYSINGVQKGSWLPLHFDLVYVDKLNHGGLLRAIELPEEGGGTQFLDKIKLYETLPERLKQRVEGLEVLYRWTVDFTKVRFLLDKVVPVHVGAKMLDMESRAHLFPRSIHPLVYRQAGTDRNMLNLSPWFADAIVGMNNDESEPLLRELCTHVLTSKNIYTHRWKKNDLVLWDNWRVLHGAEGVPPHVSRHLQRTTIAGDYGLGRLENNAVYVRELVDL